MKITGNTYEGRNGKFTGIYYKRKGEWFAGVWDRQTGKREYGPSINGAGASDMAAHMAQRAAGDGARMII